jgi:hypothetical protein
MKFFYVTLILVCLNACTSQPEGKSLSLLEYGVPLEINAPDDVEVTVDDIGIWKDVTIMNDKDFNVQLIASESTTFDKAKIIAEQLASVKDGRFFSKIIEEYEDGFIFEKKIDEDNINYDFRHIKLNGDREYIFQTGLLGTFSEEDVRNMYKSVK